MQRDEDINVAEDADIDTDMVANASMSHAKEHKNQYGFWKRTTKWTFLSLSFCQNLYKYILHTYIFAFSNCICKFSKFNF